MDTDFTTDVDVEIRGNKADLAKYGLEDIDTIDTLKIRWRLNFEMREWGVKDTYVSVPTQDITVTGEKTVYDNDAENVGHTESFELELTEANLSDIVPTFRWERETLVPDTLILEYREGMHDMKKWAGELV